MERSSREWVQNLASTDPSVRAAAVEALEHLDDDEAIQTLLEGLVDEEGGVRRVAAAMLVDRGYGDVVEVVRGALRGEGLVLAKSRNWLAVPPLLRAARDRRAFVRRAAVQALGHSGDARAVPALIQALSDGSFDVRLAAIQGLGRLGTPEAVDALVDALRAGPVAYRLAAAEALGFSGDARAVAPLMAALCDPAVRPVAATALGRLGALAGAALGPLRALLRERRDASAHWACHRAIRQIQEALRHAPAELQSAAPPPGRGTEPEAFEG